MKIDITQALKDTENALRDFISSVLSKKFGGNWVEQCSVSPERIKIWQDRKAEEEKRQKFGVVEERLIYYADFFDLKIILKKHWAGEFSEALGEWKTMEVWLDELGRLRDPDAHRRELLPHQKNLAVGIAGEIRTRLVRYRSKQETSEDYFPRIESIMDGFGNIFPSGSGLCSVYTKTILRPNDVIDFVITASDPFDVQLDYGMRVPDFMPNIAWQKENILSIKIIEDYIGTNCGISLYIRSPRKYHASGHYDDFVGFLYDVLPLKIT
jgi:hypothetical protein